jgi:hypothetical protein
VTGFGLANPKLMGEREAVLSLLQEGSANRPVAGTLLWPTRALPATPSSKR